MHSAVQPGGLSAPRNPCLVSHQGFSRLPHRQVMHQLRGAPVHRRQAPARDVGAGTSAPPRNVETAEPSSREAAPTDRGQAVVVGAGPAGCTAAMYLARQGYSVRVLERRGDPTQASAEAAKQTFIMALMPRGTRALQEIGVRLPTDGWLNGLAPAKGGVMHALDGGITLRPHPKGNVNVERHALAKHLLQEARRLYPSIHFEFDAEIQGIDLRSRTVTVASNAGTSSAQQLKYDLLVAADGINSQVRQAVSEQEPQFSFSREPSEVEYLIVRDLPAVPGIDPEDDRPEFGRYVHMFFSKPADGLAQPVLGMGAYLHEDGTYSSALQLNRGFKPPADPAAMEAILRAALPNVPEEWLQVAAKQMAGQQPRSWGSTVKCSHLAVPWAGVALVGDCAHGVTPNLGQGCNAALESVALLDKVLSVNADDQIHALSEFDRVRKPDMQALRYLDTISGRIWGGGGEKKNVFDINWPYFGTLANIWVSGFLHNIMPRVWAAPAMLNGFTRVATSYRYILWCRQRDMGILACFCMALVAVTIELLGWLTSA